MEEIYTSPRTKMNKNLKAVFDFLEPIVFALIA